MLYICILGWVLSFCSAIENIIYKKDWIMGIVSFICSVCFIVSLYLVHDFVGEFLDKSLMILGR
jgi:hypothetical protein